ncbi:Hybrid signal transduction histidine kinase J [Planktothrix tepida]|nr:Hybrid signal transduction histidine kinase J [Planktothrix pseudagardhii]CAD5982923.1 Hybrid signal transduction histidine kinase J [Planktothrix tepida]
MLEEKLSQESFTGHVNSLFPDLETWKNTTFDLKVWHDKQNPKSSPSTDPSETPLERREIFEAIAEATPIPIIISRLSDGLILYANVMSSNLFGFSLKLLKTIKTLDFYLFPLDRQKLIEKVIAEGYVHNYELQVKKMNGTPFWVMGSFQILLFQGERAILSIFHDITERKQAEQTLQVSTERLHRQNVALRDLSREQTRNCDHLDIAIRQITETAANTLEVDRVSVWLNSSIRYAILKTEQSPEFIPKFNVESGIEKQGLDWICLDLYERQTHHHSPEDLSLVNHCFTHCSTPINPQPAPFSPERSFPLDLSSVDRSISSESYLDDLPYSQRNRLDVPIWLGGKIIGFICVEYPSNQQKCNLEDRTFIDSLANLVALAIERFERRKAEQALAQVKAELEIRVKKRTTELQDAIQQLRTEMIERLKVESILQTALDQAQTANQAKSTFLANMSHELRTPLHAIIGFSDLLLEEVLDRGINDLLPDVQKIRQSGSHLLTMINEILDLCKVESGRMPLNVETFEVASLIHDVVTTLQPLADQNQNTMQICCKNNLDLMEGDMGKIRQIFYNLLSNALKFTQKGKVTLTLNREHNGDLDWICFQVSDTGIGISLEQQQTLFQAFTQVDNSFSRQYGGTGLGLTVTHHFCKMMGGQIKVSSKLGVGSTFTVYLPTSLPGLS